MSTSTDQAAPAAPRAPAPPDTAPPPESPAAAGAQSRPAGAAGHTPGGLPAVPLAVTGANTTIGALSAAVIAGGPVLAAVAATGALAVTGIAARAAHRTRTNRRTGQGSRAERPGRRALPGRRSRPSGAAGSRTARRSTSTGTGGRAHRSTAGRRSVGGSGVRGRVAGVRSARSARASAGPTRSARRRADTAARRGVADARRSRRFGSRRAAGYGGARGGIRGLRGRAAAGLHQHRSRAITRRRTGRDARLGDRVNGRRLKVRRAPIHRAARRQLAGSRRRYAARRALAALLALPLGVLGMLSSPLGRRLDWTFLVHPGRRLHARLAGIARDQRTARDGATRQERDAALTAEETERRTAATGTRAPRRAPTTATTGGSTMSDTELGFVFNEAAAEMQAAADKYSPDGAMHVLKTIEGFPEALTSIANTFKILAERCDAEFPLHQRVGEALGEVYRLLSQSVPASEEVGKVFRTEHTHDITRIEEPRTAEEMWDITNNDD